MIAVMAKILLIDDEEELLDLFHEVLQNVGHSVCKTKCWDDAGHLFDDGIKVDLIVGDVALRSAPVSPAQAMDMMRATRA